MKAERTSGRSVSYGTLLKDEFKTREERMCPTDLHLIQDMKQVD